MKTKVHPTRIIAYLVQYGLVIFFYWFLRVHFFLMLLVIMSVIPFLSIGFVFVLRHFVTVTLVAPEREMQQGEIGYLKLQVANPTWFMSFDANLIFRTDNLFYQDSGNTRISVPIQMHRTYEQMIPIRYSMNGLYRFSFDGFRIRDLIGVVSLAKKTSTTTEVVVYPQEGRGIRGNLSDMSRGMTESEETIKKGHDFSDVSDVREYIPGDKLMSIHWKLSAKRDILMVKDRVSMSDQQMVILAELSGEDELVDEILSLTYGICRAFVAEQIYVRLFWWSEKRFAFEERQIISKESLKEAYSDLYYEKTYADSEKTKLLMQSIHPELKAYVHVTLRNGEADAEVVEQD
ncbi:MAG: DUF58 domain-containing protein [Eubacterium sp.]|nr:DUF58 domain-containing protein [Eubacterium sp.]MBR6173891.1 DUF58 domain-containing protein [Eubacterium sp.]